MLQLQMDLAVQEQRFEDANAFKARLTDMKLHSQPLRLVRLRAEMYTNAQLRVRLSPDILACTTSCRNGSARTR